MYKFLDERKQKGREFLQTIQDDEKRTVTNELELSREDLLNLIIRKSRNSGDNGVSREKGSRPPNLWDIFRQIYCIQNKGLKFNQISSAASIAWTDLTPAKRKCCQTIARWAKEEQRGSASQC